MCIWVCREENSGEQDAVDETYPIRTLSRGSRGFFPGFVKVVTFVANLKFLQLHLALLNRAGDLDITAFRGKPVWRAILVGIGEIDLFDARDRKSVV